MPRHFAFLRAVNVGGRTVSMDRLRGIFESLCFAGVETIIASGNVIFEARPTSGGAYDKTIEKALREALGYDVAVFVRTHAELADVANQRPFPPRAIKSAQALNVAFLAAALDGPAGRAVMALRTGIDDFRVRGREIYWLCRKKQSESTFSLKVLEKAIGMRATLRGVKTVETLAAKYPLPADVRPARSGRDRR